MMHAAALRICEMPNIVIAVTLLAGVAAVTPHGRRYVQFYVLSMSVLAPVLAVARLVKQVWLRQPDAEFLAIADEQSPTQSDAPEFHPADRSDV